MTRKITELKRFDRADLESLAKFVAQMAVVDGLYIGDFHGQTARWEADGSLVVETEHTPADFGDWQRHVVKEPAAPVEDGRRDRHLLMQARGGDMAVLPPEVELRVIKMQYLGVLQLLGEVLAYVATDNEWRAVAEVAFADAERAIPTIRVHKTRNRYDLEVVS